MAKKPKTGKPGQSNPRGGGNHKRFKPHPRPKEEGEGSSAEEEVKHKFNDVSWYAKNPQMLKDAASLPFASVVGLPYEKLNNSLVTPDDDTTTVPGVMALHFVPTIGISDDEASPANVAANGIYSFVRYKNSGAKNYDQADLMMYLLSMDSIYMMWNWGKRLYGYINTYAQLNRYYPQGFCSAEFINYDSFVKEMANFRYHLNKYAAQISQFCVPAVMPLFIRHSWMVSNIYKDMDNIHAQCYMFTPAIFYVFQETESQFGSSLQANTVRDRNYLIDLTRFRKIMDTLLNAVAYSEDIGVMSGDILKAYGEGNLFKLSPVTEDYMVEPVYNEEVLNQIHNSTITPIPVRSETETVFPDLSITQNPDTGFLVWKPKDIRMVNSGDTTYPTNLVPRKAFLNMPWKDVTPENVMVATRLTSWWDLNSAKTGIDIKACGSELIVARSVLSRNKTKFVTHEDYMPMYVPAVSTTSDLKKTLHYLAMITNFDWHPLLPLVVKDGTDWNFCGYIGDISNYSVVDLSIIGNMHLTAVMSEFNVPEEGAF